MTKVRFHGPVAGFSGAMGEMVFADNEEAGRTVVYMKKHYPPSEAQLAQQARLAEAAYHASEMLSDPATSAFYAQIAKERKSTAQAVAIADTLNLPSFESIDLSKYTGQVGDTIEIQAVDDIGLADLEVILSTRDGSPIERGKAVEKVARSGKWLYTATAPVALGSEIYIEVVGVDHAHNETKLAEYPTVGAVD